MFGLDKVFNNMYLRPGTEAKSFMKAKTINIQKTDFILTPNVTDLVTIYTIGRNLEEPLETFREISTRKSRMRIMRLKGYYIKPVIRETVSGKKVMVNTKKRYIEIGKSKKDYNIGLVSPRVSTFSKMSYMVDLTQLANAIKTKTFDSGMLLSAKIRKSILEVFKSEILNSAPKDRDKVLYFEGPFLSNTNIGVAIVESAMIKTWSPLLLFLEWFSEDEVGFKKWMSDNKVNIVFDNTSGSFLVLSRNEDFQTIPNYNFKFVIKLLHRLDGTSLENFGLSENEIEEVESSFNPEDISSDEAINKEELDRLLDNGDSDEIDNTEEDYSEDFQEIVDGLLDDEEDEKKVATADEMIAEFENNEVDEPEKAINLLEIHNYTNLKKDIETPEVKKLRVATLKNYGMDVKAIVDDIKNHQIEVVKFNNKIDDEYNKSIFEAYDKSYKDKLHEKDLENILSAPMNLSIPMFLDDKKVTDISDREFRGYEYKLRYKTIEGTDIEVELEYPIVENNSIFIGGSKKYLTNQDLALPVIKVDRDVIYTMADNKVISYIKGKYGTPRDKMLAKTIDDFRSLSDRNNDAIKRKTTEELSDFIYDNRMSYRMTELNKLFGGIRHVSTGLDIDLDFRGKVKEDGYTNCGYINNDIIKHYPMEDKFEVGKDTFNSEELILHILGLIDPEGLKKSLCTKLTNMNFVNGIYCMVMAREIPVILLILISTPLKDLLDRLKNENGLKYSVVKNEKLNIAKLKNDDKYGYLILQDYTIRIEYCNIVNQLILSPLVNMDLTKYSVFDISHIMRDLVDSDNTSIYLENFASSFIDPNSERILRMMNLPTDFAGLFIYGCSLFYDHRTYYSSDARNYRMITTTEAINRTIYRIINQEFSANVARSKRGSRQKIVIPRDSIIRAIQTSYNISEDSAVSPFRSIMLGRSKSQKGASGVNMTRAYNMKRRMFNPNNIGTETIATPYSGQAGITKYMPFNPAIVDLTGRYHGQDTSEGLNPSQMTSFVDAFVPYLSYDDSARRTMTSGQFNHIVAVKDADPMLVSLGADESALYMCPEFSYIAKDDCEIISLNEKFLTVKYSDPKLGTVSYRLNNIERNSAKGYYIKNDFIVDDRIKVGKKIKKGAVLAYNKDFFKKKSNGQIGVAVGPLVPVLIVDDEGTWEDSMVISENLSKRMAMKLVKRIAVKFDMSSTEILESNLSIGGHVEPEDLLIKWNDLTGDANLDSFFHDVEGLNTKEKTAHYKGDLNDINVYYRLSRDTVMTDSIKRFLKEFNTIQLNNNHMKDLENNTDKFNVAINTSKAQQLTRGKFSKINGDVIENGEMLIEFFIEIEDMVGPSDKLVTDRALKGEPSYIIDDEDRPYGMYSGRKVDAFLDTQSVNARKTPGLPLHGELLAILLHIAIKNRMILNLPPEPGSLLDYKSSYDMVEGKYGYKNK